jgi:hypothetical protein
VFHGRGAAGDSVIERHAEKTTIATHHRANAGIHSDYGTAVALSAAESYVLAVAIVNLIYAARLRLLGFLRQRQPT